MSGNNMRTSSIVSSNFRKVEEEDAEEDATEEEDIDEEKSEEEKDYLKSGHNAYDKEIVSKIYIQRPQT